jgi:uncharacterized protein YaaQ
MKLIFAIVGDEDGNKVMMELNRAGFYGTKLSSTGGFLKAGNTTLLVGAEEDQLDTVLGIIKSNSAKRKKIVTTPIPMIGVTNVFGSFPMEVDIGGATIFVTDVEKFEKV